MNLSELIELAYAEDIPNGDITSDGLGVRAHFGDARLVAKEDLVLAGREVFSECVKARIPEASIKWQFADGDFVLQQQCVALLKCDLLRLLQAERVALNFLGRLSGVASFTRCFVQKVAHTECKILDTRKTTPLLRALEKQAVLAGGGHNHRFSLSDAVLIKENHIRVAGGIELAVRAIRTGHSGPIEVECSTLQEVQTAVKLGVARILLDNMDNKMISEARDMIPLAIEVEASGNMTLERVASVAETGVDFISVGALTHSAPSADFSLLFDWGKK